MTGRSYCALAVLIAGIAAAATGCSVFSGAVGGVTDVGAVVAGSQNGAGGVGRAADRNVNAGIYNSDVAIDVGPVKGGALRLYSTRPDTMNPLLSTNIYTRAMLGLIYGGLSRMGDGLVAVPDLAEGWSSSADGLEWIVKMRDGLKWHDGAPCTAYDAAATIGLIGGYGDECAYYAMIGNIESAVAQDDRTLVIRLKQPNAYTPETLVFPILPSHKNIWALDDPQSEDNVRESLVGSGHYRVLSYSFLDHIELAPANAGGETTGEDMSPAAGGIQTGGSPVGGSQTGGIQIGGSPPYIESLRFTFYDAQETSLSAYLAGETDAFFSRSIDYALYSQAAQMRLTQYSEREFAFVAFDCAGGGLSKQMRNALARLIDREALVADIGGNAIPAEFPVQPESELYNLGVAATPYDPQAARLALETEGYRIERGRYYDRNGSSNVMELGLLVNSENEEQVRYADAVARRLDMNGVFVRVDAFPYSEYTKRINAGGFDMALGVYRARAHPDITEMYASRPYFEGARSANVAGYFSEVVDRLSSELFLEDDRLARQTVFLDFASTVKSDMPYMGLFFSASTLATDKEVRGSGRPTVWDPLGAAWNWYLSEN